MFILFKRVKKFDFFNFFLWLLNTEFSTCFRLLHSVLCVGINFSRMSSTVSSYGEAAPLSFFYLGSSPGEDSEGGRGKNPNYQKIKEAFKERNIHYLILCTNLLLYDLVNSHIIFHVLHKIYKLDQENLKFYCDVCLWISNCQMKFFSLFKKETDVDILFMLENWPLICLKLH